MVLTRGRSALGLGLGVALGVALLGGCSESLFGARHGGGPGDDDGGPGSDGDIVPLSCPAPCIADAAADVDRVDNHWRYVEDHRDWTWIAMTPSAGTMTGADPGNQITTCKANPGAPACRALPGALLVSSAGASSSADPAIEFTFTGATARVIQLSLHAFVPSGADQTIRLYRNSREDVLFTGVATAGKDLARAITLDALVGDRFLVAVAPTGNGAMNVGLHLFVSGTSATFPSTCQLALESSIMGSSVVTDACRDAKYIHFQDSGATAPFVQSAGPFPEQGSALDNPGATYLTDLQGHVLDHASDVTVQLWVRRRSVVSATNNAWLFSDIDLNTGGGLGISIVPGASPMLDVAMLTSLSPVSFVHATARYPTDGNWQFVRAVVTGGKIHLCLNGKHEASVAAPAAPATSTAPFLGKDTDPAAKSYFDGWIDDVRALTGALPCEPLP